ncbi:proline-rich protein 36-like [Eucalyptus grandis]|uniref:proline-rich protein 36-like n=1 Tax=Eucalyptus grandis TaxID=71139 RepID=UPI00192E93BF|nr:proline-rich protein 36-like [Eucalyptus grandis]
MYGKAGGRTSQAPRRPSATLVREPPRPKPPPPDTRSHDDPSNAPALFAVCPVECPTSPPRRDTTAVLICPFESPDDGRSEPIVATPLSGPRTGPRLLCCSCCISPSQHRRPAALPEFDATRSSCRSIRPVAAALSETRQTRAARFPDVLPTRATRHPEARQTRVAHCPRRPSAMPSAGDPNAGSLDRDAPIPLVVLATRVLPLLVCTRRSSPCRTDDLLPLKIHEQAEL